MKTPDPQYIDARLDELRVAVEQRDGNAGVAVLDQISNDGYPEFAAEFADRLVATGLRNLADSAGVQ